MTRHQVAECLPLWMDKLQVKGKPSDKIKSLSKGNQQKVQLIATLIHQPDLIILDEPFSGLDPVNTDLLKRVIMEEKARGASIIFSDHVMINVQEISDELVMLKDGHVVLSGTIEAIREQFGKTRLFVSGHLDKEELEHLPHVTAINRTKEGLWRLVLDDASAGSELFTLITKGEYLSTFDQQPPTIDEIFKMKAR